MRPSADAASVSCAQIRSLSTYGSLLITSINVLVFLIVLAIVEPYKRHRIVAEVEGRLKERDEQNNAEIDSQLEQIKWLVLKGGGNLASWGTGVDSDEKTAPFVRSLLVPSKDTALDYAQPEKLAEMRQEDASFSGSERQTSQIYPQATHKRDLLYIGVAGTLLGGAVVSLVQVLLG